MKELDPRLNVFRKDLADKRLEGQVVAARYVEGRRACVTTPVLDLRQSPSPEAVTDSQLLRGEIVSVFEDHEGWAWVQAERDGYVGYASANDVSPEGRTVTHRIIVPRTFAYCEPDVKRPAVCALSIGSDVTVTGQTETRGTLFCALDDGTYVFAPHLAAIELSSAQDFVAVAETLLGTPYLWGGTSAFGLDCSGLVQLAMRLCGRTVLRDTDMQSASIGTAIDPGPRYEKLRRGDLVFWKGHVAAMLDGQQLIHASGASMLVTSEPLIDAISRIGAIYGPPTVCRRP